MITATILFKKGTISSTSEGRIIHILDKMDQTSLVLSQRKRNCNY